MSKPKILSVFVKKIFFWGEKVCVPNWRIVVSYLSASSSFSFFIIILQPVNHWAVMINEDDIFPLQPSPSVYYFRKRWIAMVEQSFERINNAWNPRVAFSVALIDLFLCGANIFSTELLSNSNSAASNEKSCVSIEVRSKRKSENVRLTVLDKMREARNEKNRFQATCRITFSFLWDTRGDPRTQIRSAHIRVKVEDG